MSTDQWLTRKCECGWEWEGRLEARWADKQLAEHREGNEHQLGILAAVIRGLRGEVARLTEVREAAAAFEQVADEVARLTEERNRAWGDIQDREAEVARLQSERDAAKGALSALIDKPVPGWQAQLAAAFGVDLADPSVIKAESIVLTNRNTELYEKLRTLRAEVTAAKADALEQAAIALEAETWEGPQNDEERGYNKGLRHAAELVRAADTRAELGDS